MAVRNRGGEILDPNGFITLETDGSLGLSNPTIAKDSERKHAGKAITVHQNDTHGSYIALSQNNERVDGKLVLVESDGKATAATIGVNMVFVLNALANVAAGKRIIGDGTGASSGGVKSAPDIAASPTQTNIQQAVNGKGVVIDKYTISGKHFAAVNFPA